MGNIDPTTHLLRYQPEQRLLKINQRELSIICKRNGSYSPTPPPPFLSCVPSTSFFLVTNIPGKTYRYIYTYIYIQVRIAFRGNLFWRTVCSHWSGVDLSCILLSVMCIQRASSPSIHLDSLRFVKHAADSFQQLYSPSRHPQSYSSDSGFRSFFSFM